MKSLYHIKQSEFKRLLDANLPEIDKTRIFATMARINTLYMIARAGSGHIGSSFSSMDIFSWLHLNVLEDGDLFFSSKGHDAPGLYSVLIGIGKLDYESIHKLRRLGGLPGHPDVSTPHIVTNTGSLGMGISKAKGFILANRMDGRSGRVYVLAGDGELQEGQFWESLSGAVNGRFEEITLIVDNNKVQSDTWVKKVSDLGDLESKFESYGWCVQRCDGHNIEELSGAIAEAKQVRNRPQVIIADTVKGYGVSFMESTSMAGNQEFYKFHSGAPSPDQYESASQELIGKANVLLDQADLPPLELVTIERATVAKPTSNAQYLVRAYDKALVEIGAAHPEVVVLDADLILDCGLLGFRDHYPNRFIECGIAEQDMVSMAGTLALSGKLPIAHSFACFLATRANEQIFNNASERTRCIYVGSLAGLLPSGPGHSHQMVRDISILGAVPGLVLIEPSCEEEVGMALNYAVEKNENSTYIRLVSIPCETPYKLPPGYSLEEGKGVAITEGNDAILFAYGPVMLSEACKVAEVLKSQDGFGLKVVNLPWLTRINIAWLKLVIGDINRVYTLDNHFLDGGQGERLGAAIVENAMGERIKFRRFGLSGIPECGRNDEVLANHQLDATAIAGAIAEDK